MKALLLLLSLFLSQSIFAVTLDDYFNSNELENVCKKTLRQSPNGNMWRSFKPRFDFHNDELFYSIRENGGDYVVYRSLLNDKKDLLYSSKTPIVDIEVSDDFLWIAHKQYIEKYDLKNNILITRIKTMPIDRDLTKHEVIHDLHFMNDVLYVAQGVRGVFALNYLTDQVIWNEYFNINQSNGHRSKVINIVGENGRLFAGLDNLTMPTRGSNPFNGFISFYENSPQSFIESPYDRRRAGIMAYAHTTLKDDVVYINNLGHLQYIQTNSFKDQKKLRPRWYPNWFQDVDIRRTAMWIGNVLIENDTAYGCAHFSFSRNLPRPQKLARPLITVF